MKALPEGSETGALIEQATVQITNNRQLADTIAKIRSSYPTVSIATGTYQHPTPSLAAGTHEYPTPSPAAGTHEYPTRSSDDRPYPAQLERGARFGTESDRS